MDQQTDRASTPKDATKATEEQRELQEQLEHQDDAAGDPMKPGAHNSRHDVADET